MTDNRTGARGDKVRPIAPMARTLMLIALGLDPPYTYTNHELQSAWRRRISQVQRDRGGNAAIAAAVNTSYLTLARQGADWQPVDLRL